MNPDALADKPSPAPPGARSMAIVRWVLVALMALITVGAVSSHFGLLPRASERASGGATVHYCPMHPQIVQDHPGSCPICNMSLVRRSQEPAPPSGARQPGLAASGLPAAAGGGAREGKYHCPMHPQVASDDPNATCALCNGMKLLPRPASGADAGAAATSVPGLVPVQIPGDRVQRIGVRLEKVTRESIKGDIRTVGTVEPNQRRLARISARFAGWIEQLDVADTGVKVRRGQRLATIYSPEILQAQQELLTAVGWSTPESGGPPGHLQHHGGGGGPLSGLVPDAHRRLELLGISPPEIAALLKTRKVQRAIAIQSHVEGYVIANNVVQGMTVAPGTPMFEVADLSTVWVLAEVYEADLTRVRVGQPARFQPSAMPSELFSGRVNFVAPTIEVGSRTLRVRLELPNRSGQDGLKLRPGMYGTVLLDLPASTGLMVDREALVDTGELQYLFVAKEGGRYEPRRVRVGARVDGRVQVLEGVAEGEMVVTTANFLIDSESRLRAAIVGAGAAIPEPGAGAPTAVPDPPAGR